MNRDLQIHSSHPYPCKFTPDLVRRYLPNQGSILDPYCGSGTTLVEAALRGHAVIGIDCNPIADMITRCKMLNLEQSWHTEIDEVLNDPKGVERAVKSKISVVEFAGRDHWFSEQALREISYILSYMAQFERESSPWIVLATSLSSILNTFSNQDSETRYARREKDHQPGELFLAFSKKARKILAALEERGPISVDVALHLIDLTDPSTVPFVQADFVITSPPYANTMDYYLYHKQRMNILGYDFKIVKEMEIGSRNEFSSKKQNSSVWNTDYEIALGNVSRMVKPGGKGWFVIGDSQIAGRKLDGGQMTIGAAANLGFSAEIVASEPMSGRSRLFSSSFQSPNKFEHVVMIQF